MTRVAAYELELPLLEMISSTNINKMTSQSARLRIIRGARSANTARPDLQNHRSSGCLRDLLIDDIKNIIDRVKIACW
jgi:hypothetical protein